MKGEMVGQAEMVGKAQTILGPIDADSLGVTLTHEHVLVDSICYFVEPSEPSEKELAHQPLTLQNLSWVRWHRVNHLDNLRLDDEQIAINEVMLFKRAGGDTIVELSIPGLGIGNLQGLARISQATGVNVIAATGYYIAPTHPAKLATMTEEEIAYEFVQDVTVGIGDTGVRAGIIKASCGVPLEDSERKVLRASAIAQRRTGAAICVHNLSGDQAEEIIEILGDAGADLGRTIMMHIDNWGTDLPIIPKLLETGCYLEFDGFGSETGIVPRDIKGMGYKLSDEQRCDIIIRLIAQGYLKRILMSQDMWMKIHLSCFGGRSYAHILLHVLPLMRHKGISDEQIHTIMVKNPKRVLTFGPPKE